MNEMKRFRRLTLATLSAIVLLFGIGTMPASANPPGNIAQPNTSFTCSDGGLTMVTGYVDVHFNHDSNHADDPYGSYITITSRSYYTDEIMYLDTDVRYYGQTTWHYVDSSIVNDVGSHGWIFAHDAARTTNGGYARWLLTYYVKTPQLAARYCSIAPHGWSTGEQYGAP